MLLQCLCVLVSSYMSTDTKGITTMNSILHSIHDNDTLGICFIEPIYYNGLDLRGLDILLKVITRLEFVLLKICAIIIFVQVA